MGVVVDVEGCAVWCGGELPAGGEGWGGGRGGSGCGRGPGDSVEPDDDGAEEGGGDAAEVDCVALGEEGVS